RLVLGLTLVMTEVAGPPGALVRFSSLPIRGRIAAIVAGLSGSLVKVSCDMTRAFGTGVRYPHGKPDGASGCSPAGAIMASHLPDRLSSRPDPVRIVTMEYGSVPGSAQARPTPGHALAGVRFQNPGDTSRLINSARFDKTDAATVNHCLLSSATFVTTGALP